ncbi:MAG: 50S ribosomal protein L9 [Candidatus Wildermuthbacteria bacterium]|nr:50S ribosomal protein L9 [Candidatus Wildermuthbacteria bacterium]
MKVVLLQNVPKIGKKHDVKEVADGHALNFLFPRNLAKQATKEALEWLALQKELAEKKAEGNLQIAQELASKLDDAEISLPVKIGEEGQLFEHINAQKIADRLKELGYEIKKTQIKLEEPIKESGEFPVKISLDHNLEAEIRLIIAEEVKS